MKRTQPKVKGLRSLFNTLCRIFHGKLYVFPSCHQKTHRRLSVRRTGHTSYRQRWLPTRLPKAGTARATLALPRFSALSVCVPPRLPAPPFSGTAASSISGSFLPAQTCRRTAGRHARRLFGTLFVPPYYLCKFNSAARAEKRTQRMMFSRIDNHCLASAPITGVEFRFPLVHVSAVYYKWF